MILSKIAKLSGICAFCVVAALTLWSSGFQFEYLTADVIFATAVTCGVQLGRFLNKDDKE